MTTLGIDMHGVTGIKLYRKYDSNAGCRIITIQSDRGEIEINLYGNTKDADSLPLHEEYKDYDND
jgi:hypothetical protein